MAEGKQGEILIAFKSGHYKKVRGVWKGDSVWAHFFKEGGGEVHVNKDEVEYMETFMEDLPPQAVSTRAAKQYAAEADTTCELTAGALGGISATAKLPDTTKYSLTIRPALKPGDWHNIEDAIKTMGYSVRGSGTMTDMSECDISFSKKE